ncbi:hypothetical protein [Kitasatospora sp. LaBMicrA B282]|uniref:hypothetical protein n=1 Tax=Kitasatospora sp. LaBMicrA B282 TaxID=3420949 RepID=UPI003D1328DD
MTDPGPVTLTTLPGLPLPAVPGAGAAGTDGPSGAPSLGRSLALDDGDLVVDPHTGGPAEIEGLDALVQALVLTVGTQLGSDRLNTAFGFDRLAVGRYALGVHARKEYIRMELVRCLSADPRVADVREVFFQDDPRYFDFQPGLDGPARDRIVRETRAGRSYTVYAIIDTVAGSALTLASGGRLD